MATREAGQSAGRGDLDSDRLGGSSDSVDVDHP